jgi:cobalt-zinc-cadmium efflux system outer membrane protein
MFSRIPLLGLLFLAGCAVPPPVDEPPVPRPLAAERSWFVAPQETQDIPARGAPANPAGELSLGQALDLALLHNPALEASAWHLRDRQALIDQSGLRPNPVLGLGVENFGGEDTFQGFDSARATLRISQAIELGGKRIKRIRLAQQEHVLAAWDFEAQRLDLVAQTGDRFLDVLAAQHNVELANESLRVAEQLHGVIADRVEQGMAPAFEREKAQVQVTARKIDREQRRRQLAAARQQLAAQWDASEAAFEQVGGDLHAVTAPPSFASLLSRIEQNPDWARWPAEIAARQAALKLAESSAIPNLTIGGGIRHFNLTDNQAFVVEMGIPLPLFNRNQGSRQQARFSVEEARARQRQAQVQVTARLHQLYQELRAEHYAVTMLRDESLPAAQAAFDAARQRFDQGLTNYLEVLDAERTLIETRYQQVAALAGYHKTVIRMESFLGGGL